MLWQHFLSPPLSWMPCQAPPITFYTTHQGSTLAYRVLKLHFDSEQPGWRIPLGVLSFMFFVLSQYLQTNETTGPLKGTLSHIEKAGSSPRLTLVLNSLIHDKREQESHHELRG